MVFGLVVGLIVGLIGGLVEAQEWSHAKHFLVVHLPREQHRPFLREYFVGQHLVAGLCQDVGGNGTVVVVEVDHVFVVVVAEDAG